ncbi:MAG: hypothetical protein CO093_06295 [Alphaproteobacteria bacterium CG_4_9_14_3_um_filter_47_13]|nr:MAG: hypothetical protein CO093_06295 [Alphaproteobacteria bacterium CG_4_9_14_3_um_filter_47_13]
MFIIYLGEKIQNACRKAFEKPEVPEEARLGNELIAEVSKPVGECSIAKCISLIADGARLDMDNGDHKTAFLLAAWHGHTEVFKAITDQGVNFNQTDELQNTAMMIAAEKGHGDIIDFLIDEVHHEKGRPDAEMKNYHVDTAYSLAAREGHQAIAAKIAPRMGENALAAAKKRSKGRDITPII